MRKCPAARCSSLVAYAKSEILITRSRRCQYLPKVSSCNAAILVVLYLNHSPGTKGLSKERIMLLAEDTCVSVDPMGGKGGWYDGWSNVKVKKGNYIYYCKNP